MNRHFWFGEWVDDQGLDAGLNGLEARLSATLSQPFPFDELLAAAEGLANALRPGHEWHERLARIAGESTPSEDVAALLAGIAEALARPSLLDRLRAELGCSRPGRLSRKFPGRQFEAWSPLGCVVHVMPSNVFTVAALGLVESLLAGNLNVVKLSARDTEFGAQFAEALTTFDPGTRLRDYIAVVHVSSQDRERLDRLFSFADGISAWGGEKAIAAVRAATPEGARLISWGHKVSFAYVAAECLLPGSAEREAALTGVARDVCRLDQQACSSPQTVFIEADPKGVERFAADLAARLVEVSPTIPGQLPDDSEQAELTSVLSVAHAEEALGLTRIFADPERRWRVICDQSQGLRPSPLYRTIWVKGLMRSDIARTLRPMRAWLQSCGLSCQIGSLAAISRALFSAGVTRVARLGEMVDSYLGAPHDGVYALQQFSRRVSLDGPESAGSVGSFAELESAPLQGVTRNVQPAPLQGMTGNVQPAPQQGVTRNLQPAPLQGMTGNVPILSKSRFQELAGQVTAPDLVFRSGGSSGSPVFSMFSWDDYHDQMEAAAHGLLAAGLDPEHDVVINLFASGYLYGSFISFWTILEKLRTRQLPMGMVREFDQIADAILTNRATVAIGLPSHILGLFAAEGTRLRGQIKKVFFGGERMTRTQREFLHNNCGVEVVRSAAYGSNDAGPMGYQCPHCEGGVHHLMGAIQQLEIVALDADRPVQPGETGRLLLTSSARDYPRVIRYEIGDTGRWVPGACPCGRSDPRFELQGRMGDVFKAGAPFFNARRFVSILDEQLAYSGPVQLHIREDGHLTVLQMWVDATCDPVAADRVLHEQYEEIAFGEQAGLAFRFEVCVVPEDTFERAEGSGKLRPVCDHREG